MQKRNWAKTFTLAGFFLGEAYMLYTALAPNLRGVSVPWDHLVQRCLALALFFGPFGAAVGWGIWMLILALISGTQADSPEIRGEDPAPEKKP